MGASSRSQRRCRCTGRRPRRDPSGVAKRASGPRTHATRRRANNDQRSRWNADPRRVARGAGRAVADAARGHRSARRELRAPDDDRSWLRRRARAVGSLVATGESTARDGTGPRCGARSIAGGSRPNAAGRHQRDVNLVDASERLRTGQYDRARTAAACRGPSSRQRTSASSGPEFFGRPASPMLRGRLFTDADRGPGRAMPPALVSEPTAKRRWPGQDAVGRTFSRALPGEEGFKVVGVVADARITSLERTPPLMVYLPYWWRSRAATSLLIKAGGDPSALMPSIRRAIREFDPGRSRIGSARPLEQLVEDLGER